ncbi:hypothetical protein ACB092_05G001400 [Castanea dentata]
MLDSYIKGVFGEVRGGTCPPSTPLAPPLSIIHIQEEHIFLNLYISLFFGIIYLGFISIDCGATKDYLDDGTGIFYKSDTDFIDTGGTDSDISPEHHDSNHDYGRQTRNLRSFPQGKKNCYTLKPEQGTNSNYLIRPFFYYGNYDNRIKFQMDLDRVDITYLADIIHVPTSDIIYVCLINTGFGIPFISVLKLRPLYKSLYPFDFGALTTGRRFNLGTTIGRQEYYIRYKNDVYDRLWYTRSMLSNSVPINTSSVIDIQDNNDSYQLPSKVLRTAIQPSSGYHSLSYSNSDRKGKNYVCFHFAEIAKLTQGKKREFIIDVNRGSYTSEPITLDYLKPLSICLNRIFEGGQFNFVINATTGSDLPSILNEPFIPPTPTVNFSSLLTLDLSWNHFENTLILSWIFGLRNLASLDLSGNDFQGPILVDLQNMTSLSHLDLYRNNFNSSIPNWLYCFSHLEFLSVSHNNLQGTNSSAIGNLTSVVSIDFFGKKPDLCLSVPCMNEKKKPKRELIVALVATSRVVQITDNFKTIIIGERGFGKVYLGILKDETQVAVKLLSTSSKQGYKEFRAEAQLLMIVHHKNLVFLVGYCDEGENKALIYEYMANGNLKQNLSGLEYLHNGCKPPIIHRDLKTSNILLDENMQAKIVDFGLSRAFATENDPHSSTSLASTFGYLDPESQTSRNLNKKGDVYSFGIVLFELITGRPAIMRGREKNTHILDWVYPIIKRGDIGSIVDPRLQGEFYTNSAWKAVEIAMSCIPSPAIQRPDMSQVLVELKECLDLEIAHGRSQTLEIEANETISSIPFTVSSMELQSDIATLAR